LACAGSKDAVSGASSGDGSGKRACRTRRSSGEVSDGSSSEEDEEEEDAVVRGAWKRARISAAVSNAART
jgi:hypothetical protein